MNPREKKKKKGKVVGWNEPRDAIKAHRAEGGAAELDDDHLWVRLYEGHLSHNGSDNEWCPGAEGESLSDNLKN